MIGAEILLFVLVLVPGFAVVTLFIISSYNPWPKRSFEYIIRERRKYCPNGKGEAFATMFKNENANKISDLKVTKPQVYLSVVVPAMNEEDRLPSMLDECLEYLERRAKKSSDFTYEVIIVDDGSKDRTSDVAFGYSNKYPVYVHKLERNVGKGGAVRCGVLCSRGSHILFADADGATTFEDFGKLEEQILEMKKNKDNNTDFIAIGSRAHLQEEATATRTMFRTILMLGFHMIVYIFAVRNIRDTQCGFKLFTRGAAAKIFARLHVERWAFDVEILKLATLLRIPIKEVSVKWTEIEGSKINPIMASLQMGRDIMLIWFRYFSGIWTL